MPRRLQALVEYRTPDSVARVMTWSDEWNSRVRLAWREQSGTPTVFRSYFRVSLDAQTTTEIAVTNAGHPGYDRSADLRVIYQRADDHDLETALVLAPFATCMMTLDELFPLHASDPRQAGFGIVLLESTSDLAGIAFTRHRGNSALAAEHFLWLYSDHAGEPIWPVGS